MYQPNILPISFPALALALSLRYPPCNSLLTLRSRDTVHGLAQSRRSALLSQRSCGTPSPLSQEAELASVDFPPRRTPVSLSIRLSRNSCVRSKCVPTYPLYATLAPFAVP